VISGPAEKTFLLGAGCHEGGTTRLFQYLEESQQFAGGYLPEYHVFDALDLEGERSTRDRIFREAEEALAATREGGRVNGSALHRLAMYGNPELYYDYFAGLLMTRPAVRLTADLTPDYGLLPAERFRDIREGFARRGVRAASILVVRDPVDRIWSHIRMQAQRSPSVFDEPLTEVLRERHGHDSYALRTRYDRTLAALDDSFGAEDLHVVLYEELFTPQRLVKVCAFLGIDYVGPEPDGRTKASEHPAGALPEDLLREVATQFSDVYDAVAARLPGTDLAAVWPSARFVR
jgi:hypothetical protein